MEMKKINIPNKDWFEGVLKVTYQNLMIEEFQKSGNFDLPINANSDFVSIAELAPLLKIIAVEKNPTVGMQFGLSMGASCHGATGFAAISSKNAETALRTMNDYVSIRNRCFRYCLDHDTTGITLTLRPRISMGEFRLFIEQATLFTLIRLLQTAIGTELVNELEINASWSALKDNSRLHFLENLNISYDKTHSAIHLPKHLATQPCLTADTTLYKVAIASCEKERHYLTGSFSPKVERLLKNSSARLNSLSDVASQLNISKRTLIRKLRSENTSYRKLLNETRFELAQYYLLFSQKPISEIAIAVGFSDASNFSRTFRRWCGTTPYTYRARLKKNRTLSDKL